MTKNIYKNDLAIVKATMLNNWNPMFMPWSVDFFNERLFNTPFRSKQPIESKYEYVNHFIDFLTDHLYKKGSDQVSNESILSIYVKNFLSE